MQKQDENEIKVEQNKLIQNIRVLEDWIEIRNDLKAWYSEKP